MTKQQTKPGFTIIEVVLVLAVAGLILAMVFIGLPALRRSQQMEQRRRDGGRIVAAVQEYQSRNSNKLPFQSHKPNEPHPLGPTYVPQIDIDKFITNYIDDEAEFGDTSGNYDGIKNITSCSQAFQDPDGSCYNIWFMLDYTHPAKPYHGQKIDFLTSGIMHNGITKKHMWYVFTGTRCSDEESIFEVTNRPNDFSMMYLKEHRHPHANKSATDTPVICIDNQ